MTKPLVFISHVSAEKEIAIKLKEIIEDSFRMVEVFVSSDPDSNPMGGKWLERITHGLKNCCVELIVASPHSVARPWINFEAGAGWVREIPVIPICHSSMKPSILPVPLSSLQGALATDPKQMQLVFDDLAKEFGCTKKEFDFADFIGVVKSFEEITKNNSAPVEAAAKTSEVDGLRDFEIATLFAIANFSSEPTNPLAEEQIKQNVRDAGFKEGASAIGMVTLYRRKFIDNVASADALRVGVSITKLGWDWFEQNSSSLDFKSKVKAADS